MAELRKTNFLQGGYKATLSSAWIYSSGLYLFLNWQKKKTFITDPLTSPEAKKRAQNILYGVTDKNEKRVMGGYKAVLKSEPRNFHLSCSVGLLAELYIL